MKDKKISIIIPAYNSEKQIERCINSILKQSYNNFEVIIIDDGSKDATLHNLRKLHAAQKCPVKVISFSRNFGKEAGLYAGMQHASGEYISLIDADLQQRPEIVRDMVHILDEEPDTDVVAAFQDRRGEGKVLSATKCESERDERLKKNKARLDMLLNRGKK